MACVPNWSAADTPVIVEKRGSPVERRTSQHSKWSVTGLGIGPGGDTRLFAVGTRRNERRIRSSFSVPNWLLIVWLSARPDPPIEGKAVRCSTSFTALGSSPILSDGAHKRFGVKID